MHTAQSTAERTCSATPPNDRSVSPEAHGEAYFERIKRCVAHIALLGDGVPANDPEGVYAYWYASPKGIVAGRREASTLAAAAAHIVTDAFPFWQTVKAVAIGRRGARPDALYVEVDGRENVKIVPASSSDGHKILVGVDRRNAQDALAAMAAARLRGEEAA